MIKNLSIRLNCDKRGKITSGIKTDKGFPKSVDYFDVSDFPEIIAEYGAQPKKILIAFPVNDIASLFDCNYVLYGNQTKIRQCDGEVCIHRIDEEINSIKYKAGEESKCLCDEIEDDKKRCRCAMYLKCWILKKDGTLLSPNIYLFHSGSENSAANINSELQKVRFLNSEILQNIPFGLSVEMISSKEEAKKKFPIWSLQAIPRTQLGANVEYLLPEKKKELSITSQSTIKTVDPILGKIDKIISTTPIKEIESIDDSFDTVEDLSLRKIYIGALQQRLEELKIDYEIRTLPF
jgi:hypothetical protein